MEIQKEMEQYEAVLKEAGYGHRSLSKSSLGYLNPITQFGFEVWFNAQKQAVPEGFVLVSKDKLHEWKCMARRSGELGCPDCYESRGYSHNLAEEIEAQEQNQ